MENPYAFNFANSKSRFIVSKAFKWYINKTQTLCPLSKALFKNFSSMVIKECCALCDFRNPVMCFDSLSVKNHGNSEKYKFI